MLALACNLSLELAESVFSGRGRGRLSTSVHDVVVRHPTRRLEASLGGCDGRSDGTVIAATVNHCGERVAFSLLVEHRDGLQGSWLVKMNDCENNEKGKRASGLDSEPKRYRHLKMQ